MKDMMDVMGMTDLKEMKKFDCLDAAYERGGSDSLDVAREYWRMKEDAKDLKTRAFLSVLLFICSLLLLSLMLTQQHSLLLFLAAPVFLMTRKVYMKRSAIRNYRKQTPVIVLNIITMALCFIEGIIPVLALSVIIVVLSILGIGSHGSRSSSLEDIFIFHLLF